MRRSAIIAIACLSAGIWVEAHTFYTTKITWSRDVSRIFYRSCASCHRPGGSSFSLVTYREARPWAEAIKQQVLERRMPPWNAVKGFGEFKNDRGLTQEDLEIIAEWVNGGVPEGNAIYLPPTPDVAGHANDARIHERILQLHGTTVLKQALLATGIKPNIGP